MWCGSLNPCCGGPDVPLGLVSQAGVRAVALLGGLCLGPVFSGGPCAYSWVSRPCPLPLLVPVLLPVWWPLLRPGSLPCCEGVVVGCAEVFSAAASVGVAPFPRVGVPSFPCAGSGGRWARAAAVRAASGPCFGGASWRACTSRVARGQLFTRALPMCAPWCPSLRPLPLCHGPWSFPFLAR